MKTGDIVELDRDIMRLEKQLSNMYQRRVTLLESEMESSRERFESLTSGSPGPAPRSATDSGSPKVTTKKTPKAKKKAAGRKTTKKASGKKAGKTRKRMSSEDVEKRLVETVKAGGSDGLSLKAISDAAGVNYQTTAKKLREMQDQFEKRGALKEARYFLKS